MEPITESYRGHQIEIKDENFAIAGLVTGGITPKLGVKAVVKVDGDDVTGKCESGETQNPEAMIASARKYVDKTFFAGS
jgi:hypothetical protein